MKYLKYVWFSLVDLINALIRLPWWLADFFLDRKQRADADAHEVERLDRIRNPSKYIGK